MFDQPSCARLIPIDSHFEIFGYIVKMKKFGKMYSVYFCAMSFPSNQYSNYLSVENVMRYSG